MERTRDGMRKERKEFERERVKRGSKGERATGEERDGQTITGKR